MYCTYVCMLHTSNTRAVLVHTYECMYVRTYGCTVCWYTPFPVAAGYKTNTRHMPSNPPHVRMYIFMFHTHRFENTTHVSFSTACLAISETGCHSIFKYRVHQRTCREFVHHLIGGVLVEWIVKTELMVLKELGQVNLLLWFMNLRMYVHIRKYIHMYTGNCSVKVHRSIHMHSSVDNIVGYEMAQNSNGCALIHGRMAGESKESVCWYTRTYICMLLPVWSQHHWWWLRQWFSYQFLFESRQNTVSDILHTRAYVHP